MRQCLSALTAKNNDKHTQETMANSQAWFLKRFLILIQTAYETTKKVESYKERNEALLLP